MPGSNSVIINYSSLTEYNLTLVSIATKNNEWAQSGAQKILSEAATGGVLYEKLFLEIS